MKLSIQRIQSERLRRAGGEGEREGDGSKLDGEVSQGERREEYMD